MAKSFVKVFKKRLNPESRLRKMNILINLDSGFNVFMNAFTKGFVMENIPH